jgi:hypothetical protein
MFGRGLAAMDAFNSLLAPAGDGRFREEISHSAAWSRLAGVPVKSATTTNLVRICRLIL